MSESNLWESERASPHVGSGDWTQGLALATGAPAQWIFSPPVCNLASKRNRLFHGRCSVPLIPQGGSVRAIKQRCAMPAFVAVLVPVDICVFLCWFWPTVTLTFTLILKEVMCLMASFEYCILGIPLTRITVSSLPAQLQVCASTWKLTTSKWHRALFLEHSSWVG